MDHFRARVLQDALTEATAAYWENRAQQFEAAAARPGDFNGQASRAELVEQAARCLDTARACRRHARLIRAGRPEPISAEVRDVLTEVA